MYEYHNSTTSYNIIYTECCKHKWSVEKFENKEGKWIKNNRVFKRFDTLDEAKAWALKQLHKGGKK